MKPVDFLSMLTWREVEIGGILMADGIRILPNKEPFNQACPTYGQAAQLLNVGYTAIQQSPILLNYLETLVAQGVVQHGIKNGPLTAENKLQLALNSVTTILKHMQTSETGNVEFALPVPQAKELEE
jgi:hypothetical protein